jgi:uncharacterized membrane protein YphA (DoxX/SURF4 family)
VSILVGFQARLGAWVLVAFLIPVTLVMHNFWGVADSAAQQISLLQNTSSKLSVNFWSRSRIRRRNDSGRSASVGALLCHP